MSVLTEPGLSDATAIQDLFPKLLGLGLIPSESCHGLGPGRVRRCSPKAWIVKRQIKLNAMRIPQTEHGQMW
jgi:hypothetical protein